jgi:hypothetical protein
VGTNPRPIDKVPSHLSGRRVGERDALGSAIQTVPALDTEAVSAQIVMAARSAHQPARRIRLQPALSLAPVPDPILWTEHPAPTFPVEHREVTHREPKRARLQRSGAALFDQKPIPGLGVRKRINGHAEKVADSVGCRIR